MAALVAPVQIFAGDTQGLNTLQYQPAKVMAMEGHYTSHPHGAPLIVFGIPNQKAGRMDYAVEIPKLSSLVLKHDLNAPLSGLDRVPRADWPPVYIVFWSFRIMVGLGFAMLTLGLFSLLARVRHALYDWPWLHRAAVVMGPSGFIAVIAGWVTTEVGRQPYTIYHLLRTSASVSAIAAPGVGSSLAVFVLVYFFAFGFGAYYILKLMSQPPNPHETLPAQLSIRSAGITPALAASGAAKSGKGSE
jgi:cytochrome d ubiquinol oxidase subunit I